MKGNEFTLISRKITKPSSPTPDHLRHYRLSFTDQLCPPVYKSFVFFYPAHGDTNFDNLKIFQQLHRSLSQALTHLYPLAGRLHGNLYVDCNDKGIPFQQARILFNLSQLLENPVPSQLNKLLPFELDGHAQEFLSGIQFNIFKCGGIGIGVSISHKIADILSFFVFVKVWAAICRGEPIEERPQFASATLFPARDLNGYEPSSTITRQKIMGKRFVFSNSSVEALIAKYYEETDLVEVEQQQISCVDVLSAFIWSQFIAATELQSETERGYELFHMLNLRTIMHPPLSEYSFGNIFWPAVTVPCPSKDSQEFINLVSQIRESIRKVDNEHVKLLHQERGKSASVGEQHERVKRREVVRLTFSNLCGFPIYEADFGWGKPIWAGAPTLPFKNQVIFADTANGEGIEALVQLTEEDMAKFRGQRPLLEFVDPTGSQLPI